MSAGVVEPDWTGALCREVDPELWFPERGGATRPAKRLCRGDATRPPCPIRAECLEYALANDERWGVWGGLSERERYRLKWDGMPDGVAA